MHSFEMYSNESACRKGERLRLDQVKHIVDYDYKVGDKVILINHTKYKYETP